MSVLKKIRIGTDIKVQWPITTNGDVQSLDKRDLTLELVHIFGRKKVDFYTIGNTIIFNFRGVDQTNIGSYTFTLWENLGKNGQTVVDSCDAFELVLHSCMESEDATSGLGLEQVSLPTSNIIVGVTGASAYEIWLELGNIGTQEDFINWLRQPAVDAASKAKDAASEALAAAGRADSATETAMATNAAVQQAERLRVASEQERVSAESQRTKAEQVRTTAESDRNKAEQARVTAESQRAKAESQRGTVESARVLAEIDRTNAETERKLSEKDRKQSEETRIASEQTRTTAESSRVKAEESRQTAEQTRTEAETKRQQDTASAIKNAEAATTAANDAAGKANTASENAVLKVEQKLTPEEQTQVQSNIGVKDTIDVVGVGEIKFIDVNNEKEADGYWNKYGAIAESSSTNYFHTKPIPVNQGDIILLKDSFATAAVMPIVRVQSDNTFISVIASGNSSIYNYSAIAQTGYISLSVSKSYASRMQALIIPCKLSSLIAKPVGGYCHSLYEAAGAIYDDGLWKLNELQLTNDEMAEVYTFGNLANSNGSDWQNRLSGYNGKTTLPYRQQLGKYFGSRLNLIGAFSSCPRLEILKISAGTAYPKYIDFLLYSSVNLRKVSTIIDMQDCESAELFAKNARALEYIHLTNVKISLSFSDSPLLDNESILYLITNAENKSITFTLHPDAYDRAMSDSSITAALAAKPLITIAK